MDELENYKQYSLNENNPSIESQIKLPIKVPPFEHQIKGYNLVCNIFEFNREVV